jgi:hypothetical protein
VNYTNVQASLEIDDELSREKAMLKFKICVECESRQSAYHSSTIAKTAEEMRWTLILKESSIGLGSRLLRVMLLYKYKNMSSSPTTVSGVVACCRNLAIGLFQPRARVRLQSRRRAAELLRIDVAG